MGKPGAEVNIEQKLVVEANKGSLDSEQPGQSTERRAPLRPLSTTPLRTTAKTTAGSQVTTTSEITSMEIFTGASLKFVEVCAGEATSAEMALFKHAKRALSS